MNRRNFIGGMLAATAGFSILPGSGRIWKAKRAPVFMSGGIVSGGAVLSADGMELLISKSAVGEFSRYRLSEAFDFSTSVYVGDVEYRQF